MNTIIAGLLSYNKDKFLGEKKTACAVALLEQSLCWPASCPPQNMLSWQVLLLFASTGALIGIFLPSLDPCFVGNGLSFQFFLTWLKAIGTLNSYVWV